MKIEREFERFFFFFLDVVLVGRLYKLGAKEGQRGSPVREAQVFGDSGGPAREVAHKGPEVGGGRLLIPKRLGGLPAGAAGGA